MVKNRSGYLDFLKGFAILLVVMGHCIQYGSGTEYLNNGHYYENVVFKIIYSFHMPLFMLVSGYLFENSVRKYSWNTLLARKFSQLVIPVLSWTLISQLVKLIVQLRSHQTMTLSSIVRSYFSNAMGMLWFLWAVFFCSVIIIIVRRFLADSYIIYSFLFLLSLFTPDYQHIALYKFMYPYFLLGYTCSKKKWLSKTIPKSKIWVIECACILVYVLLLLFYDRSTYIYTTGISILGNPLSLIQVRIDVHRYLIGLTGSISAISLSYCIYSIILRSKRYNLGLNFIEQIGRNTMGIYIVSSILFSKGACGMITTVFGANVTKPVLLLLLLETTIMTLFAYGLSLVLKRIKVSNILLLGGR